MRHMTVHLMKLVMKLMMPNVTFLIDTTVMSLFMWAQKKPCREPNAGLRGGRQECYHSTTMALDQCLSTVYHVMLQIPRVI